MSDDEDETVVLAIATTILSSCALLCNRPNGLKRNGRHSLCVGSIGYLKFRAKYGAYNCLARFTTHTSPRGR